MIIFNEEPKDIVEIKHICFYTMTCDNGNIVLKEVVEKKLKHPEAKEQAYVYKYDTSIIKEFKRTEYKAASTILLEAAQNNLDGYKFQNEDN
jgi:hypothetical protein